VRAEDSTAPAAPVRWVTAHVLARLAATGCVAGSRFTSLWLASAVDGYGISTEQRQHATGQMLKLGFLKHRVAVIAGERCVDYTVTEEGAQAIAQAAAGLVRKSGPKGSRKPSPVRPEALATRLWNLVRMRQVVDSDACTQLLCNAGEQEFKRVRATVQKTLRRWELAGALQAGERRVQVPGQPPSSNGNKRYVLVKDSPLPPAWSPVLKQARQAAQAAQEGARA